jgi:hypothetical protein
LKPILCGFVAVNVAMEAEYIMKGVCLRNSHLVTENRHYLPGHAQSMKLYASERCTHGRRGWLHVRKVESMHCACLRHALVYLHAVSMHGAFRCEHEPTYSMNQAHFYIIHGYLGMHKA